MSVPKHPHTGTPTTPHLPAEVIHHVLEELPQKDLWMVSRASRQFYAHALDAGLYVHRKVRWGPTAQEAFGDSLTKLNLVLAHAESVRPDLNISIHAYFVRTPRTRMAVVEQVMQVLAAALQRARPNLVWLHLSFFQFMPNERPAARALGAVSDAPKLRYLNIKYDPYSTLVFPLDGSAPQLREVSLTLLGIHSTGNWQGITSFGRVTHLRLEIKLLFMPVTLATVFPVLRVLLIESRVSYAPGVVDLQGLALRYLAIRGPIELLTDTSLASLKNIPVVELGVYDYSSARCAPPPSGWYPCTEEALCSVVECRRAQPSVSFGPRGGAWRRTIVLSSVSSALAPVLAGVPTLESLSVHYALFNNFASAPIVLPALRELYVDVAPGPDPDSKGLTEFADYDALAPEVPRVQCPALSRVVLFSRPAEAPPAVSARRISQILSALGLRGSRDRPTLTLAGCEWSTSSGSAEDATTAAEIFSLFEQVGAGLPEYYVACSYSGCFNI